jgi:hypothetical protein
MHRPGWSPAPGSAEEISAAGMPTDDIADYLLAVADLEYGTSE